MNAYSRYSMKGREGGFTLIELLVALVLMSGFLYYIYMANAGVSDNISRQRNEVFPEEMVNMIKDHYVLNNYEVDSITTSEYIVGSINIPNRSLSTNVADSLSDMIETVPFTNLAFRDGYNQPMLILVSNRLEQDYEGTLIPYRVFAVVSTGGIDVIDPNNFNTDMDVTTGRVTEDPEETVVIINTFQEQLSNFKESQDKVRRMSKAYAHYYWARHNIQIGDISRNYFAGGGAGWDNVAGNKVSRTCATGTIDNIGGNNTPGIRVNQSNFIGALGLSSEFERNAWGGHIYIMNCGTINNVRRGGSIETLAPRNPDNATRSTQPFNAIIGFTMSNGESYFEIVSSRI